MQISPFYKTIFLVFSSVTQRSKNIFNYNYNIVNVNFISELYITALIVKYDLFRSQFHIIRIFIKV